MNDLIKGAVRQKNITNKNQMPEWMKREQERASQKKADIAAVMDVTQEGHHQSLLDDFEKRKRARKMAVSTDDKEVKATLRALGEPITLFGEDPADRRSRLRMILSEVDDATMAKLEETKTVAAEKSQMRELNLTTWYHEGPDELIPAREFIRDYSIPRGRERLSLAREYRDLPEAKKLSRLQLAHKSAGSVQMIGSQVGDTRPLSSCNFSPDSNYLATGSFTGNVKVWSVPDLEEVHKIPAHDLQVGAVVWHPGALVTVEESECCLATTASNGEVKLWSMTSDEPLAVLEGHEGRVPRANFHPSGRFLGVTCYDASWRLWDLEAETEVLHQEGHLKGVHDIAFQEDGALVATTGLDTYGRVWDLRSGRCVQTLAGHLKEVYCVTWSPNCYQLATGSADNHIKIWDIRQQKCIYSIPAHKNIVTSLRYQKGMGDYLVSGSYDSTAAIWACPGFLPVKTLTHSGKLMSADLSSKGDYIATSSYDRIITLWGPEMQLESEKNEIVPLKIAPEVDTKAEPMD